MMRKKCFWVLVVVLIFLSMIGIEPVQGYSDNKRITQLKYFLGNSVGKPSFDGELIFWTERVENKIYPCYLNINEGSISKLDNNTFNQEIIAAKNGVLVYRAYGSPVNLTITNISEEVRFGLLPGESKIIEINGQEVSDFYVVNEEVIIFLTSGIQKDFYMLTDINESPKHLFKSKAQSIDLSHYKGRNLLVWYYIDNDDNGRLDYCDLDNPENINTINTPNGIKGSNICTYGNQIVYFDNNSNLVIQEIDNNSTPGIVPVNAAINSLCLMDNRLFYVDREMNICVYDFKTSENRVIIKLNYFPRSLASNGNDIAWKDYDNNSYWYAGLVDLRLEGVKDIVANNDTFQLKAVAIYTNGEMEEVTQHAQWYSSNTEVIAVEKGLCQALSWGTAVITAEYDGTELSIPILVRDAVSIEIIPPKSEFIIGEIIPLKAYLVYSDGSRLDVTDVADWLSGINDIEAGLYRADKLGRDEIKVYYEGLEGSLAIAIKDLEDNKSDETDNNSKPETRPGSSSSRSGYDNIEDSTPVFQEYKFQEIIKGESWYFDIIRMYLKLWLPFPLSWIV